MASVFEVKNIAIQAQPTVEQSTGNESISINWLQDSIESEPVTATLVGASLCVGAIAAVVRGRLNRR